MGYLGLDFRSVGMVLLCITVDSVGSVWNVEEPMEWEGSCFFMVNDSS